MDIVTIREKGLFKTSTETLNYRCEQSARSNKANRMVRVSSIIDGQINKTSNKVQTASMTNKQKRKFYAQISNQ